MYILFQGKNKFFKSSIYIYIYTNLNSDFRVPRVRRMMLDEYEKCSKAQTRVDREISGKQDALNLTERMPR